MKGSRAAKTMAGPWGKSCLNRLPNLVSLDVITRYPGDIEAGRWTVRVAAMCDERKTSPSPRAFFTNLQGPEPWFQKIRMLFKNNWIKLKRFQNCCGHLGEPGC
jgi:hypothetical protein